MPIPGPRNQYAPLPGYANPGNEDPDRFNRWGRPGPVIESGRSPGTMVRSLRGNVQGAGQVRRMWRQTVNLISAQAAYSWTRSAPGPGRPIGSPGPVGITRALRYLARSTYVAGGTDATRIGGMHTQVRHHARGLPVTIPAGGVRNRPTLRNRMTSFGSRVPVLNSPSGAADNTQ